ncbi:hypothetical protein BASA60_002166 [Batrachochytrium salamandrivorans]|nr:hypothetical protein BASA60_002166 [Batrachochytrium salamandrivorans]
MQKNQNSKGKPAPVVPSLTVSVRMRSICPCDTEKARDVSPPPQDDLWVVVKNLSQQVAAQQAEMDALPQHYCSPAKGTSQPGENPWQPWQVR